MDGDLVHVMLLWPIISKRCRFHVLIRGYEYSLLQIFDVLTTAGHTSQSLLSSDVLVLQKVKERDEAKRLLQTVKMPTTRK